MTSRVQRIIPYRDPEPPAPKPEPPPKPELVPSPVMPTWQTAATYLGITRCMLRTLVAEGEIRPIRVGNRVLFAVRELERWADEATGTEIRTRR